MGLFIEISVQKQSEDLAFSAPMSDINAALKARGMPEFFEDGDDFLFLATANEVDEYDDIKVGDILFVCPHHGDEPSVSAETWGLFDESCAAIVGEFVTAGTLVLRQDVEGNDPEYYKITPNKGELVEPSF